MQSKQHIRTAVVTLIVVLSGLNPCSAQRRSDPNVLWERVKEYQSVLRRATRDAGITVSPNVEGRFQQLTAEESRAQQWAIRLDAQEDRLMERDRALGPELSNRRSEKAGLERTISSVQSEKSRLEAAIRAGTADQSWINSYKSRAGALEERITSFNRRNDTTNAKLEQLKRDFDQLNDETLNRYNPMVLAWEGRLRDFQKMQLRERQRILDKLNKQDPQQPKPDLMPPKAKLVATIAAQAVVDTINLPATAARFVKPAAERAPQATIRAKDETIQWAKENQGQAAQLGILVTAGAVAVVSKKPMVLYRALRMSRGTAVIEGIDAATAAAERKTREKVDQYNRTGLVAPKLNAYRRKLLESGKSDEEKKQLWHKKVRAVYKDVTGEDYQPTPKELGFWDNVLSKEVGTVVLKEAVVSVLQTRLKGRLDKATESRIESADEHYRHFLQPRHKPSNTGKLLDPGYSVDPEP